MGVDPTVLEKIVADFNIACQTGVDKEFGRTYFGGDAGNLDSTSEIKEGPYYATLRKPAAHITKGGTGVAGLLNALHTDRAAGQSVAAEK